MNNRDSHTLTTEAQAALAETAERLAALLAETAGQLRPFPAFLGMVSVQAVEIEPRFRPSRDVGCVVVNPDGQICGLEIATIEGIAGLTEPDQVEEMKPLELGPLEYIVYASAAIEALTEELRKRGK